MFGSDKEKEEEIIETIKYNIIPLVKVDTGEEVISFSDEEASIDVENRIVRVDFNSPHFSPTRLHLPTETMSAVDNIERKSEILSYKIVDVKKYSKVTNEPSRSLGSDVKLPYYEIHF